nr:MAG TPA: hypothetical protein [Caudoviricetes sp.]
MESVVGSLGSAKSKAGMKTAARVQRAREEQKRREEMKKEQEAREEELAAKEGMKNARSLADLLTGSVFLRGISREKILEKLNEEQMRASIEHFKGHTIASREYDGKTAVWLEIAKLAEMNLKKERVFVRTYEGKFLVDKFVWER